MGFFKKVFGGGNKADAEVKDEAGAAPPEGEEAWPEPEPDAETFEDAATTVETEVLEVATADIAEGPVPQAPADTSDSNRGVPDRAASAAATPTSGKRRMMSAGGDSLKSAANTIGCSSCERMLPVPLAGHATTVVCPFCLGRTEYNPAA